MSRDGRKLAKVIRHLDIIDDLRWFRNLPRWKKLISLWPAFFSFSPLLFCFCLNTNMGGRGGDCFAFTCTAEQSLNTPQVVSSRQTDSYLGADTSSSYFLSNTFTCHLRCKQCDFDFPSPVPTTTLSISSIASHVSLHCNDSSMRSNQ